MSSNRSRAVVLLIEDHAKTCEAYTGYLRWAGFTVVPTCTSVDAVRCFDENPPDVVMLDMSSREGDRELLEQITARSLATRVPVLLMTSRDLGAKPRGTRVVLRKPVAPEALLAAVQRFSRGRQRPRPADVP
jgi:DNA-binding response OmpR family regulator